MYSLNTTVFQDLLTWVFTFTNKGKREMRKHVFPLLLIALTIIAWCVAWPNLPEEVPSHWNVSGEVDGHMSKMGGMILMWQLWFYICFIDCIA